MKLNKYDAIVIVRSAIDYLHNQSVNIPIPCLQQALDILNRAYLDLCGEYYCGWEEK